MLLLSSTLPGTPDAFIFFCPSWGTGKDDAHKLLLVTQMTQATELNDNALTLTIALLKDIRLPHK